MGLPENSIDDKSKSASNQINLLIPAYFYPGSDWDRLLTNTSDMPGRNYIIVNPDNGPGHRNDKNYEAAIDNFREKGGKVLGYVYTQYCKRNIKDVKKELKSWYSFYNIDGVFLDEQSNVPGEEKYYQNLYNSIKSINPELLIFGNPGTITHNSYLINNKKRVTDVICLFEEEANGDDFMKWLPPSWIFDYQNTNFAVLIHNAAVSFYKQYVDYAKSKNIGWLYITDMKLPNPWNRLPTFFEDLCEYIMRK